MARRSSYDPLQRSNDPRWIVVRNMHRSVLEQRLLAPGSDLYGAFAKALATAVDEGWQLETFSSANACAFCNRGSERRVVAIEFLDPKLSG